jgi:ubiquinone/menaquinone biosynthesis C-methylase UbiE
MPSHEEWLLSYYRRRDAAIHDDRYSIFNPGCLFAVQSRERVLLAMLRRSGRTSFSQLKILDLGCGTGVMLRTFNQYGANPQNLFGVDLLPDRLEEARRLSPLIDYRCVTAEHLPFDDESFDLVCHFTLFDTIPDPTVRNKVAREMVRVLRNDGIIVWYDFRVNNPSNPDARKIGKREIQALFQGCGIELTATTLAPPITRLLAPRGWLLATLLEKIPFLCTHYIGLIRKPNLNGRYP